MESVVLGNNLCFKIYFLIDINTIIWTEMIDLLSFSEKIAEVSASWIQPSWTLNNPHLWHLLGHFDK